MVAVDSGRHGVSSPAKGVTRWRGLVSAACALVLSSLVGGCALPPALAVASYLGDGVLLAATGKSSTDMGLSLATGKDCSTLHILREEDICQDKVVAQPEAIPVEVAQDDAAAGRQLAMTSEDDAVRADQAHRAVAAAFQPMAAGRTPTVLPLLPQLAAMPVDAAPVVRVAVAHRAPAVSGHHSRHQTVLAARHHTRKHMLASRHSHHRVVLAKVRHHHTRVASLHRLKKHRVSALSSGQRRFVLGRGAPRIQPSALLNVRAKLPAVVPAAAGPRVPGSAAAMPLPSQALMRLALLEPLPRR